ncbi:hypothetical protein KCU81_g9941, partial [Aureobasidium melanogenum]|uniref:NAD(P)-binding protein n=2 Tax=Aureobasidium melanogenum TaxID=46634 RepID=A0A074VJ72_AURM1
MSTLPKQYLQKSRRPWFSCYQDQSWGQNYDRNSPFTVEGLVVVITGVGSGLGSQVALALDTNGAKAVYIFGRRQEALDRTIAASKNNSIEGIICDVTFKDSLGAAASRERSEQGYINVLYTNSGVMGPSTSISSSDKDFKYKPFRMCLGWCKSRRLHAGN